MLPRFFSILLACLAATSALSGCRSRCSSDSDCFKACQCHGQDWCAVGLLCENTFCEAEEGIPCGFPGDTFCDKWGNNCGTRKCNSEQDCRKTCMCQGTSASNPPLQCCVQKELILSCNEDKLCDPLFAQNCDFFCQNLDFQFTPICAATDRTTGTQWSRVTCPTTTTAAPQQ